MLCSPARSARTRCEEYVTVDDLPLRQALLLERLQVLNEIAYRKVRRIALPVVAVFLTGLERLHIRGRNGLGTIAQAFQGAMDQLFVLPGQTSEKKRGVSALIFGEHALDRLFELVDFAFDDARLFLQARAFFRETLLDHILDRADLDQVVRRRWFGFEGLSAHRVRSSQFDVILPL